MWYFFFFFSSRRRHTRSLRDWSSDVCSSDLAALSAGDIWRSLRRGRKTVEVSASTRQVRSLPNLSARLLSLALPMVAAWTGLLLARAAHCGSVHRLARGFGSGWWLSAGARVAARRAPDPAAGRVRLSVPAANLSSAVNRS